MSSDRDYRAKALPPGLSSFRIVVRETDLWISADRDLEKIALDLTLDLRRSLEGYIEANPGFLGRLSPWPKDPFAPPLVREMIESSSKAGVGPMAAVAGAIAEFVGRALLRHSKEVVVENGGDVFLMLSRPCTVSILAGDSPLSGVIGIRVPAETMPAGVCTSSGTVGHSLSYGAADAVCVLARSASLADAAATSLANRVRRPRDLQELPRYASAVEGIIGGVGILGESLVAWGCVEIEDLY